MPFYIIEREYVGPNRQNLSTDRKYLVDGHYFVVQDRPGLTNMSNEPRTEGWLGTTGDWSEAARGEYPTEEEARREAEQQASDASEGSGCRLVEPERGQEFAYILGDEECRVMARYYVGDETWANLWDAGDWLASASDEEIGLRPELSEKEITALCERLRSEAEAEDIRLWDLEGEIKSRLSALEEEDSP